MARRGVNGTDDWKWLASALPMYPICPGPTYCACPECAPRLTLPAEQLGERHTSVRFGLGYSASWWSEMTIAVEGRPVSLRAFEALAGPSGWVQAYTRRLDRRVGAYNTHSCACGKGVCQARIEGLVTIKMRASEALVRALLEGAGR